MKHVKKEFELVYKKYAKQIYGYILKLCKNPTEAEDILQITFLKAIEKSDSFDGIVQKNRFVLFWERNKEGSLL